MLSLRTYTGYPTATVPGDVPVVYVYAPSDDDADTSFTPDNVMAGRLAAERLLKAGRTRIALVNGEASYAAARDRAEGVAQAMEEARVPLAGGKSLFGRWGEGWGRDCARLLASAHSDLDGIVAGSDHIARGVIDALREEGRRVPDDVSVVGFDN